jgi:hypothetical protein
MRLFCISVFMQLYIHMSICVHLIKMNGHLMNGQLSDKSITRFPGECTRQWISKILAFSSQRQPDRSSANRLLGPYNVYPLYGHNDNAWAPQAKGSTAEYLEVEFERAVYPTAITVYETCNAGAVSNISVRDPNGAWIPVFTAHKVESINQCRKFTPNIERPNFKTNAVRITLDCSLSHDWVEIDAIALYGSDRCRLDEDIKSAALIARDFGSEDDEAVRAIQEHRTYSYITYVRQYTYGICILSEHLENTHFSFGLL